MPATTRGRAAASAVANGMSTDSGSWQAASTTADNGLDRLEQQYQGKGAKGFGAASSPGRVRPVSPARVRTGSPLRPRRQQQQPAEGIQGMQETVTSPAQSPGKGKVVRSGKRTVIKHDASHPLLPGLEEPAMSNGQFDREHQLEPFAAAATDATDATAIGDGSGGEKAAATAPPGAGVLSEGWNMALLILLYMMQGVPLGLTTGAMPFMLQSKLSFSQVGVFSLAAYPYSLKLLWSPVVDSCYSVQFGRRKSWIVPVQLATAAMLICCSGLIQRLFEAADVNSLTALFLVFVFLAATQDIAVDGWALTLLSPANVCYASTCQTIGVTLGYFTSFTVFLALNNGMFCDSYIRSWAPSWLFGAAGRRVPLVSLVGYLRFWGWVFAAATVAIAAFQPERNFTEEEERERMKRRDAEAATVQSAAGAARDEEHSSDAGGIEDSIAIAGSGVGGGSAARRRTIATTTQPSANGTFGPAGNTAGGFSPREGTFATAFQEVLVSYRQLWGVVRLPAVWALSAFLLTYRLGMLSAESAYSLKLIDKGVSKEALAFLVLFQFPIELGTAVLAGRWATNHSPYGPFITGYLLRLAVAATLLLLTASFPAGANSLTEHAVPFGILAATSLVQSFASTLTFTALGSFFNAISDPAMGGAYLTLLNTIANMGYLIPRTPLFWLIDVLTVSRCVEGGTGGAVLPHLSCPKKAKDMILSNACTDQGGVCVLTSDGFYLISWTSIVVGVGLGVVYLRMLPLLMRLPLSKWRVPALR